MNPQEKSFNLSDERRAQLDKFEPSPAERAEKFKAIIDKHRDELTDHDISCFAVMWLAGRATTLLEFMQQEIRDVCRMFFFNHYYRIWRLKAGELGSTGDITSMLGEKKEIDITSSLQSSGSLGNVVLELNDEQTKI